MATADTASSQVEDRESLQRIWLERLGNLISTVSGWVNEWDWSTREIQKKMEETPTGSYMAPALLLQKETVRLLLEPISRSAPGVEGIVDLYLMPAYDDIATLYFYAGGWHLYYMFQGSPTVATIADAEHKPLSRESLKAVLDAMISNAN